MPGSMVGKVQFSVKAADASLTKAGAPMVAPDEEKPVEPEKPKMPWDDMKMAKSIEDAVAKGIAEGLKKAAPVAKAENVEKAEGKAAPESKQVQTDEQRAVRKSAGYRFGESFENVVFARQSA